VQHDEMTAASNAPDQAGSATWLPIPGPVDRTSFFEEQARHRRATWRVSALCILAIVVTAIPFSAIVGPLFYGIAALGLRITGVLMPLPDAVWVPFRLAWQMMDQLVDKLDRLGWGDTLYVVGTILGLLSPGIIGIILTWLWLRIVLTSDGVGGVLLQLGAREPIPGDLEEQQLVNVVAEMAIAAGLKPPNVLLIDAPVANAAAIGTGPDDAKVVVTRRLLDELNRDETQGVLGHLIASIGNGDLRVGVLILSLFQTLGILATVLDLPISSQARGSMFRFVKSIILGSRDKSQTSAVIAASLLAESMADRRMNEINVIMDAPDAQNLNPIMKVILNIRRFVLIPPLLLSLFGKMVLTVIGSLLMGQTIAWAWRTRRFLADATAVQLTRNPDGLGRALEALADRAGLIPGGQWASHLFIVGGGIVEERATAERIRRMDTVREKVRGMPTAERIKVSLEGVRGLRAEAAASHAAVAEGTFDESMALGDMHPSLAKRINRLRAQGAQLRQTGTFGPSPTAANIGLMALVIGPLILICGGLMAVAIGLMTMLAFLAFEIGMAVVLLLLVPGIQ
jgi:Zn-dependent protease with chaperone function